MNIRQKALDFATKAHKGQKRKDGKDYITHPIAVAEIAEEIAYENNISEMIYMDDLYVMAILHDVVEDTDITIGEISETFGEYIASGVQKLTRTGGNYFDFIMSLGDQDDPLPIIVKIADLEHNMSDLNEGSMKDKYRFAHHYLTELLKYEKKNRMDRYRRI
jgi:GTP pyrophosphokinase